MKSIKVTSQVSLCEAKDPMLVGPLRQAFHFYIITFDKCFLWYAAYVSVNSVDTTELPFFSHCIHSFFLFISPLFYLSLTYLKHTPRPSPSDTGPSLPLLPLRTDPMGWEHSSTAWLTHLTDVWKRSKKFLVCGCWIEGLRWFMVYLWFI